MAGMNTYGYVLQNPIMYFDPNGEDAASATAVWATYTGALGADLALPDPSDLVWPKWAGWAIAGIGAAGTALYCLNEEAESSPYPPGQKCKFKYERQWPGAKTKTCVYECPGYNAPVTWEQAAGHACPGIKKNGEVDLGQIVKP